MPILFYGDAHKDFAPLFDAVSRTRTEYVRLLGDLELEQPLHQALAPVFATGPRYYGCPAITI